MATISLPRLVTCTFSYTYIVYFVIIKFFFIRIFKKLFLGDLFSVHSVENPSFDSELELLRNFGPSLPDTTLRSLVRAFSQLRSMADEGQLNYPYSTREVINVVKHLEVRHVTNN